MPELAQTKSKTPVPIATWSPGGGHAPLIQRWSKFAIGMYWLLAVSTITGAVQLYVGTGDEAFRLLRIFAYTALGLIALGPAEKMRKATPDDTSLLDDPDDPLEKVVRLEISRDDHAIGEDTGVLRVDQDSLGFVGRGTSFCVGAADLIKGSGRYDQPIDIAPVEGALRFRLQHPEGDVTLKFWPLPKNRREPNKFGYFAHALEERHETFAKTALALTESTRPADLERVFPPLTPQPAAPVPVPVPEPIDYRQYAQAAAAGLVVGLLFLPKWPVVFTCPLLAVQLLAAYRATQAYLRNRD